MDEHLTEYYNVRAEAIRQSSWAHAFLFLVICMLAGTTVFFVVTELAKSEQAREVGLVFVGLGLAYLTLRYAIVWFSLRRLKIQVAKRAMIE